LVEADGNFDATARGHRLLGLRTDGAADKGTADGASGVRGAAATDVAAEDATCDRTCECTALAAAFDFTGPDRGYATGLDSMGAASFTA
jgi:hypothetical protein